MFHVSKLRTTNYLCLKNKMLFIKKYNSNKNSMFHVKVSTDYKNLYERFPQNGK